MRESLKINMELNVYDTEKRHRLRFQYHCKYFKQHTLKDLQRVKKRFTEGG